MSRALRSIELKFGYILYIYKSLNLNVIKQRNAKVFNRLVAKRWLHLGTDDYNRQLERNKIGFPLSEEAEVKLLKRKSVFHNCQKWFEIRYKFVSSLFSRHGDFLNWVSCGNCIEWFVWSSFKGILLFSIMNRELIQRFRGGGSCYWQQQVALGLHFRFLIFRK